MSIDALAAVEIARATGKRAEYRGVVPADSRTWRISCIDAGSGYVECNRQFVLRLSDTNETHYFLVGDAPGNTVFFVSMDAGGERVTTTQILTARIKHSLALLYLCDLSEWKSGDATRFSRMVDGRGKQLGDASRWLAHLAHICANPFVVAVFPDLPADVAGRLYALGLELPAVAYN